MSPSSYIPLQSIIFYVVRSSKLREWLSKAEISASLAHTRERKFVDLDPIFNVNIDLDYDVKESGITRSSFCNVYQDWVSYCVSRRGRAGGREEQEEREEQEGVVEEEEEEEGEIDCGCDSPLISLCLALSLLGKFHNTSHKFFSVSFLCLCLLIVPVATVHHSAVT